MTEEAGPPRRRPTLDDVAVAAGVSRAMVSIVLRGAPGSRAQTREKVLAAAKQVGYRPDARARLLASGSSRQIGVVVGMSGRFHAELLDGLYRAAGAVGQELILSALTPHRDERVAVETLLDFRCEAVILLGPGLGGVPVLAGRLPVTVVGWRVADPAVDVVRSSDTEGMRALTGYLAGLGHRRIAHVDGGSGPIVAARRRAYRAALDGSGLGDGPVLRGGDSMEAGVRAARTLLELPELPTAVIGFNDDVAAGLVEGLRARGLRVPDDVSVSGWDDSPLAGLPERGLTTLRQDPAELARLAVARSVDRLRGRRPVPREVVLSPELVVRGSTGPAAVGVRRGSRRG
ncbi:LacI family DNA-binding transcriptional regulator [Pseudonocardia nematodicida]|uniref:LacI family DNA-binding transcriptional regulator n=1 Tax=Pseudonocardia nematodicida TaxID=1206997 RepID=A0ABV1KE70_9PSEU